MTREIKFRAWDGENMSFPCDVGDIIGGHLDYEEGKTILMQFTGLKDKNGKEIYEGDLIKGANRGLTEQHYGEVVHQVKFENGAFIGEYWAFRELQEMYGLDGDYDARFDEDWDGLGSNLEDKEG